MKNLQSFLEDSKPLIISKSLGKWKVNEKVEETEDKKSIYQMPYVNYSEEVMNFISSFHHNKLVIPFDSSEIPQYLEKINDPDTDFSIYTVEELLKMLSIIIKGHRIVEGLMLDYLKRKRIQKILSALESKL